MNAHSFLSQKDAALPSPEDDSHERLRRYVDIAVAVARRLERSETSLTESDAGATVFPGSEVDPQSINKLPTL